MRLKKNALDQAAEVSTHKKSGNYKGLDLLYNACSVVLLNSFRSWFTIAKLRV